MWLRALTLIIKVSVNHKTGEVASRAPLPHKMDVARRSLLRHRARSLSNNASVSVVVLISSTGTTNHHIHYFVQYHRLQQQRQVPHLPPLRQAPSRAHPWPRHRQSPNRSRTRGRKALSMARWSSTHHCIAHSVSFDCVVHQVSFVLMYIARMAFLYHYHIVSSVALAPQSASLMMIKA